MIIMLQGVEYHIQEGGTCRQNCIASTIFAEQKIIGPC